MRGTTAFCLLLPSLLPLSIWQLAPPLLELRAQNEVLPLMGPMRFPHLTTFLPAIIHMPFSLDFPISVKRTTFFPLITTFLFVSFSLTRRTICERGKKLAKPL